MDSVMSKLEDKNNATRIFPENEYKKDGSLKKLRGRVLKKLFKYEIRALAPTVIIASVISLVAAVLLRVAYKETTEQVEGFLLTAMLYAYTIIGSLVASIIMPFVRYGKSMFKEEGYITHSIPATAEELVFAKNVTAICTSWLVGLVELIIGIVLFYSIPSGDIQGSINEIIDAFGYIETFGFIETVLISICCGVVPFVLGNAMICWFSGGTSKKTKILLGIGIYFAFNICTMIWAIFMEEFSQILQNGIGLHVAMCVYIAFLVGLIVLGIGGQLRYLKKKLNLK